MCPREDVFLCGDSMVKTPTTFDEQVEFIERKGFVVDNKEALKRFLEKVNYYRFSAYLLPFRKSDKTYLPGVNADRIINIYEFDSRLRQLLFRAIERIELYVRTQLAYHHSHKYGALGYTYSNGFDTVHKHDRFSELLKEVTKNNRKTLVVQHHEKNYAGKFPLWVIIEYFSTGMLSYFYSDMTTQDKKAVARQFGATYRQLDSWLRCLTDMRNKCAHYSRLYFWRFAALPVMPEQFVVFANDRTLFPQIIMLKMLFPDQTEWNSIVNELELLIQRYEGDVCLAHVGFPDDWKTILRY